MLMLCTAFPTENTDALFAMSTRFRNPKRLLQSGSLITSAYLHKMSPHPALHVHFIYLAQPPCCMPGALGIRVVHTALPC